MLEAKWTEFERRRPVSIGALTGLSVTGPSALRLSWDDGARGQVEFSAVARRRRALAPLLDPEQFARAALSDDGWSVEWPGGIDFGSAQLRRWSAEQAGETMSASAFRQWIEAHGFTLDRAAAALGLLRRTVAYYLSGEQPVPKTVMLATIGFDRRDAA